MDIISAYREVGLTGGRPRSAARRPKTVKRVIARHEAGGGAPARVPRERNYDAVAGLVAERVDRTSARISAKRLLPAARAAGMRVAAELPPPGGGAEAGMAAGSSPRPPSGGVVAG